MNDYYDACPRESKVYFQPDIEGYLDKKETGVLRTKTTRRWCWIQGSIFYQQKPQTNNSGVPGGIEVLDMADVHYVKNLSADTTGKQFEIFIKKSQIYICSSREECTAWIKALHKAIALKGPRRPNDEKRSTFFSPLNEDYREVYSEIPDQESPSQTSPSNTQNGHTSTEEVYAMPLDLVENIYSDVPDVDAPQTFPDTTRNHPESDVSNKESVSHSPHFADGVSTGQQENDSCYADGYSIGPLKSNLSSPEGVSTGQAKQNTFVKNDCEKGKDSSLFPRRVRKAPVAPHVMQGSSPTTISSQLSDPTTQKDIVKTSIDSENVISSEDQLIEIFNSMDTESVVPDLEYLITNEDAKLVADLKTYLRHNDVHCRVSTNRLSSSQDPIGSCKTFLASLDDLM